MRRLRVENQRHSVDWEEYSLERQEDRLADHLRKHGRNRRLVRQLLRAAMIISILIAFGILIRISGG